MKCHLENTDLSHLRRKIIEATIKSKEGHIPSAFSILDILWVLYSKVLNVDPSNPLKIERDRFVLSKGHGSLALYAVLAENRFFPLEELETFGCFESRLGGHPDCNKVPGVETSTGSLGHGLPMAVGMALGLKIKNAKSRVFCLIGDGEANEGSIWEACLVANHHALDNLCIILDYNHSTDRAIDLGDIESKFKSFGFHTSRVNGHDHNSLYTCLSASCSLPQAIIADTIKGHGCEIMENNPAWHHRSPTKDEFSNIILK